MDINPFILAGTNGIFYLVVILLAAAPLLAAFLYVFFSSFFHLTPRLNKMRLNCPFFLRMKGRGGGMSVNRYLSVVGGLPGVCVCVCVCACCNSYVMS